MLITRPFYVQWSWTLIWSIMRMKELAMLKIRRHQSIWKYWNRKCHTFELHTFHIFHILSHPSAFNCQLNVVHYATLLLKFLAAFTTKSVGGIMYNQKVVFLHCICVKARGKSFCKTWFQVGMELKKVQKQGRDERTQEDCPTSTKIHSRSRVVFLRSFISVLLLYLFQLLPYLKSSFKEIFPLFSVLFSGGF